MINKIRPPKLMLSKNERIALRQMKIKLADIADMSYKTLYNAAHIPVKRCKMLIALAQFQKLDSVGHLMAEKIWRLGYTSLKELAAANPVKMYRDYCKIIQQKADPCVEDVFRCAIAQARTPNLPPEQRQWWIYTKDRSKNM